MQQQPTNRRAAALPALMIGVLALGACESGTTTAPAPPPAAETKPAASAAKPASSGPAIATYNGKSFTLEDYRAALAALNTRARKSLDDNPDRRKQFVENHILSELIFDEGVRMGLDEDAEIQRRLDELRQHLVVQQVMEKQQSATVTDDDVRAYYDSHQQEFSTERVKASHILVDDETLAKDLYGKLQADKEQFAALAAEHSKDLSNAKRGGELGFFGRGRMVKEFEDAAFGLAADGDISEPVQTRFGWHVIMRLGREEGTVQPFDQVKSQIKVRLVSERRRENTASFLEDLKKKSALTIDDALLASATSGATGEGAKNEGTGGH